jgi:hypothetical protein
MRPPPRVCVAASVGAAQPFPGTVPLDGTNDLADVYLSASNACCCAETSQLAPARERLWREGLSAVGNAPTHGWSNAAASWRGGWVCCDARTPFESPALPATLARSAVLGENGRPCFV